MRNFSIFSLTFPLAENVHLWRKQMTFKVGEQAFIVENHSYVTPVVVVRSYGDFYTVAAGRKGINLRASRLFKTREDAERTLPTRERTAASRTGGSGVSPYDYMNYRSPYGL